MKFKLYVTEIDRTSNRANKRNLKREFKALVDRTSNQAL